MDRLFEARKILEAVKKGEFTLRTHARKRGLSRNISIEQIVNVAHALIEWKWQENQKTHLFIGYLEEGKGGGFTAAMDQEVWIVTVFKRTIKKWQRKTINIALISNKEKKL